MTLAVLLKGVLTSLAEPRHVWKLLSQLLSELRNFARRTPKNLLEE